MRLNLRKKNGTILLDTLIYLVMSLFLMASVSLNGYFLGKLRKTYEIKP